MKSECEEKECTSGSPKRPHKRWPRWLFAVTALIVILIVIKPFVLPPLFVNYGGIVYDVYDLAEYAITIVATGASLYSVGLAVEGGRDMKEVFAQLGSLDEDIFGRLDELDGGVAARLEKLDGDVSAELDRVDAAVVSRLDQINRDVLDKLNELDHELFAIHEDLRALNRQEDVEGESAEETSEDFTKADAIDDTKKGKKQAVVKGGPSDVHEVC